MALFELHNQKRPFLLFHTKLRMNTYNYLAPGVPATGFLNTKITESPRRNILDIKRSLLTGLL